MIENENTHNFEKKLNEVSVDYEKTSVDKLSSKLGKNVILKKFYSLALQR